MRYAQLFAVMFVAISTTVASAITKEGVTVTPSVQPAGVILRATNANRKPVEITIEATDLVNVRADRRLPHTMIIPPRRRVIALKLIRISPREKWTYEYDFYLGSKKSEPTVTTVDRETSLPETLYRLPYPNGYGYRVSQTYNGEFSHQGKNAIDWTMPEGTTICAARTGRVIKVVSHFTKGGLHPSFLGKSNQIHIEHRDGTVGRYVHLQPNGSLVKVGQLVKTGDPIGKSGKTGFAQGPHLHFEVGRTKTPGDRETVPVEFHTLRHESVIPQTGTLYIRPFKPDQSQVGDVAINAFGEFYTSDQPPSEDEDFRKTRFARTDVIHLVQKIGAPEVYKLKMEIRKFGQRKPLVEQIVTTSVDSGTIMMSVPLNQIDSPRGTWLATVYFRGKQLGKQEFFID